MSHKSSSRLNRRKDAQMDSFDKGWFVLQPTRYENKVKENLLHGANLQVRKHLRVEIPTSNRTLRKSCKTKEIEENKPQVMSWWSFIR